MNRRTSGEIAAAVLDVLAAAGTPLSAYDIADGCTDAAVRISPTQVYRTLGRLIAEGRVHRIETLSSYVPADGPCDLGLICTRCHSIRFADDPAIAPALLALSRRHGFTDCAVVLEVEGLCSACRDAAPPPTAIAHRGERPCR